MLSPNTACNRVERGRGRPLPQPQPSHLGPAGAQYRRSPLCSPRGRTASERTRCPRSWLDPSLQTRSGPPPAARLCHQDAEGPDADQLPLLPRDRLREPTALTELMSVVRELFPRGGRGLRGAQIPAARPPGSAGGRQPGGSPPLAQLLPALEPTGPGPRLGGAVGSREPGSPGERGSCVCAPFVHQHRPRVQ